MEGDRRTELHPDFASALETQRDQGLPTSSQVSPDCARRLFDEAWAEGGVTDDRHPVDAVRDYSISGPEGPVPVRIYSPEGETPLPVLLWIHCGGWIRGDLDTPDLTCRKVADRVGCAVVSVDYRLTPEHPSPAALKDCYAALGWIDANPDVFHGDGETIAVGGTSAGGNLVAALSLASRDRDGPEIAVQILDNAALDRAFETDSYEENARGYGVGCADMRYYWDHYLAGQFDGAHPYVSPLRTRDVDGLSPAIVTTAGFDVLRDEGIAYVERLEEAGVPVEHFHHPNVPHAALTSVRLAKGFERSYDTLDDVCTAFQDGLTR